MNYKRRDFLQLRTGIAAGLAIASFGRTSYLNNELGKSAKNKRYTDFNCIH
jgi:hypothetical protein